MYGLSKPPGMLCWLAIDSTCWTRPTIDWYSLSASPSVALNCSWASNKPWISSIVWTMNMSTKSSRAPSNQLLKGYQWIKKKDKAFGKKPFKHDIGLVYITAALLANSKWSWSIFSSTRSASSNAWRRDWVSDPSRSHWSQISWQRALTEAVSW